MLIFFLKTLVGGFVLPTLIIFLIFAIHLHIVAMVITALFPILRPSASAIGLTATALTFPVKLSLPFGSAFIFTLP